MKRPVSSAQLHSKLAGSRGGYTLIEILVATTLTLIMMFAVVQIFASISGSIRDARSTLEMSGNVRSTVALLQLDLAGATATMLPPLRPEDDEGYLEYNEGTSGVIAPDSTGANPLAPPLPVSSLTGQQDSTIGDVDDILMLTTRSRGKPFVGRYYDPVAGLMVIESQEAEVAWFVRGRTLYRRVLLVKPSLSFPAATPRAGFYENNDISVRFDGTILIANTLGDLTKRENRFAHPFDFTNPLGSYPYAFPYRIDVWGRLGLPTLRECSSVNWDACTEPPVTLTLPTPPTPDEVDLWNDPHPWPNEVEPVSGTLSGYIDIDEVRVAEDVILRDVIGFDVKAWDPGAPMVRDGKGTVPTEDDVGLIPGDPGYLTALLGDATNPRALLPTDANYGPTLTAGGRVVVKFGAYVDLGYAPPIPDLIYAGAAAYSPSSTLPQPHFNGWGYFRSGLRMNAGAGQPRKLVYDTWSFHYEQDGVNQDGDFMPDGVTPRVDEGTDGFDDDTSGAGYGIVDDAGEMETAPPYPHPLRGIQVKIRAYERDSRQIREVTVKQDFLPK